MNDDHHLVSLPLYVNQGFRINLLNTVRSLKGLALLSLNLLDSEYKEKLQNELLKIISAINSLTRINSLPQQNSPVYAPSSTRTAYGFRFQYNLNHQNRITVTIDFHTGNNISSEIQSANSYFTLQTKLLGLHGLAEEMLAINSDVVAQLESYKQFLQKKLNEVYKAKKNLEEFIKEKSLEEFSKRFREEADNIPVRISTIVTGLSIVATGVVLYFLILKAMDSDINSANWQFFLTKLTIVAILGGISIYLLKYTIKLIERRQEYRYKALTLSTFPALNVFLRDDHSRYELIKTLILENQKLQTLSTKEEKLPVEEIVKVLSIIKSSK